MPREIDAVFAGEPARQRRDARAARRAAPDRNCAPACAPRGTDRARSAPAAAAGGAAATQRAPCAALRPRRRLSAGAAGAARRRGCAAAARAAPRRSVRDHRDHGADRRDLARRHADLREHAGGGRRHLHRHLVGLDLEQVVARLDRVAGRLEPLRDLALGDGLAELRHQHVHSILPLSSCLSHPPPNPTCTQLHLLPIQHPSR